jgi:hypothetical protein
MFCLYLNQIIPINAEDYNLPHQFGYFRYRRHWRDHCVLLYGGMGANTTTLVNLPGSSFLSMDLDEVEDLIGDRPSGADCGEDSGLS